MGEKEIKKYVPRKIEEPTPKTNKYLPIEIQKYNPEKVSNFIFDMQRDFPSSLSEKINILERMLGENVFLKKSVLGGIYQLLGDLYFKSENFEKGLEYWDRRDNLKRERVDKKVHLTLSILSFALTLSLFSIKMTGHVINLGQSSLNSMGLVCFAFGLINALLYFSMKQ